MTRQEAEAWVGKEVDIRWLEDGPGGVKEADAGGVVDSVDDEYIHLDWGWSVRIDAPGITVMPMPSP